MILVVGELFTSEANYGYENLTGAAGDATIRRHDRREGVNGG